MAIYKIPVTVLSTGDELLYLDFLYISDDESISNDQFKTGKNVNECALTLSAITYASSISYTTTTKNTSYLTKPKPCNQWLIDTGFKHPFTATAGIYHWIINGQKFETTITEIIPRGDSPYGSLDIGLKYISGSYLDLHPEYKNLFFRIFESYTNSALRGVLFPTDDGYGYSRTPNCGHYYKTEPIPHTIPKYYNWGARAGDGGVNGKRVREILFNIPINQNAQTPEDEKVHIGDTYPEYDPTASGPTSGPINPEDNPDIGDFDTKSEPIPPPDIDELNKHSAVNTGLISIYNPTIGGVAQLANFLWSDLFSLDTFKKMFGSPMEAILSLHLIPVQPTTGTDKNVIIGNVDTGITMSPVTQQFVSFHCGAVKIQSFFGSALDFSPFTKMSIFLPYIGVRELDVDEIMYKSIGVQYLFDVLTGACTALITVDGDVMYQFSGSASLQMPINATNWTNVINNIMSLATATIATVASSGAAAGQLLTAGANAVTSSKMSIERSGAVTGAAGFLGVQTPYLIRTIPRQSLAKNYQHYSGYPSNITAQLGSLSGYTEVEQVFLDGVTATEAEKTEILSLLKGGVII